MRDLVAMVLNMTSLAESFAIGGVQDKREQFLDLSLVVSIFGWVAASFATAIGGSKNTIRPSPGTRMPVNQNRQRFHAVSTFPCSFAFT